MSVNCSTIIQLTDLLRIDFAVPFVGPRTIQYDVLKVLCTDGFCH